MGVGLVFGVVAGVGEVFVASGSGADPEDYVGVFDSHLGGFAGAAEFGSQKLGSLLERFDGCCGDELFADFGYVVGCEAEVAFVFLLEFCHKSGYASEWAAD